MFFDQVHQARKNIGQFLTICFAALGGFSCDNFCLFFSTNSHFKVLLGFIFHESFLFLGGFGLITTPNPGFEGVFKFLFLPLSFLVTANRSADCCTQFIFPFSGFP